MKFLDYIQENKDNHAVMSFGRMNPITKGHEKLVNKVQQVARQVGGSHHIVRIRIKIHFHQLIS